MSGYIDDIKLKLAWQTAFELRTCPGSHMLYATDPDDNLKKHLAICHICREKREMPQTERDAWKTLRQKFATITMKPGIGTEKQAGQVWTIKSEFGGWREDGRYVTPPTILLLEKIDGTSGWQVAQLYRDARLIGTGDVALDECYGFAETFNCYALKDDRFDKFLGGVNPDELKKVVKASIAVHDPAPEGSILSFFRSMEIEVGAYFAVPAVAELVAESEAAAAKERMIVPGLTAMIGGVKEFGLWVAGEALDTLHATFAPQPLFVTRGSTLNDLSSQNETIKYILTESDCILLKQHLAVIPIETGIYSDGFRIWFHVLNKLPDKPIDISVRFESEMINSYWEKWDNSSSCIYIPLALDKYNIVLNLTSNLIKIEITEKKCR